MSRSERSEGICVRAWRCSGLRYVGILSYPGTIGFSPILHWLYHTACLESIQPPGMGKEAHLFQGYCYFAAGSGLSSNTPSMRAYPKSASQRKRSDLQQVPSVALLERTGDGDFLTGWQLVGLRSKSFVCDALVRLGWLGRTGAPVPLDLVGGDER